MPFLIGSHDDISDFFNFCDDPDLKSKFPLHYACKQGDLSTLNALLNNSSLAVDGLLSQLDPYCGWTPAMWAAFCNRLDCLERALPAALVGVRSSRGLTALHVAAVADSPDCVHWLLKIGASHHLTDNVGETALHKAARSRSHECTGLLAVCGADFSVRNNVGFTPSEVARMSGNSDFMHINGKIGMSPMESQQNTTSTPTTTMTCHISTNGYYGYQQTHKNGDDMTSAMEQDEVPCECSVVVNNGFCNGHNNNGFTTDVNGRKRSLEHTSFQYSSHVESFKKMRHEEPSFEQQTLVVPPAVPSTSSTTTFSNKRCEISYPRCMMGHYM